MGTEFISKRIAYLRTAKNISAREMSLALNANDNYINHIENQKAMPSMEKFLEICDYLAISPADFFDGSDTVPETLHEIIDDLKKLNSKQISSLAEIIKGMS